MCMPATQRASVQAAYQIFWMLLILFGAPVVFDRYEIRGKCAAFREGHSDDTQSFCSHSDVTELDLQSQFSPTEICNTVTFPLGDDGCPASFKEPTEEFVNSVVIGGAQCVGDACTQLLEDSRKVRLLPFLAAHWLQSFKERTDLSVYPHT